MGVIHKANKNDRRDSHPCERFDSYWSIEELHMGVIKDKFEPSSKLSLTYATPYTQKIDNLKMLDGYQLPKLQQFDGKEDPKTTYNTLY